MKKTKFSISILFYFLCSVSLAAMTTIKSIMGVPFGSICILKAKFIDKPNDYYSQNMSQAKYYLKIFEINNKKLATPIVVEPVYKDIKIDKEQTYTLKAYEVIESQGSPKDWTSEAQQINYQIRHKVVVKN